VLAALVNVRFTRLHRWMWLFSVGNVGRVLLKWSHTENKKKKEHWNTMKNKKEKRKKKEVFVCCLTLPTYV